jgi:hypothetical protein
MSTSTFSRRKTRDKKAATVDAKAIGDLFLRQFATQYLCVEQQFVVESTEGEHQLHCHQDLGRRPRQARRQARRRRRRRRRRADRAPPRRRAACS